MSVMMDIIFAAFIGGVICLIVINANFVINETVATYNSTVVVQQMLIADAQIVESEFRNIGCGVSDTADAKIKQAMDTSITFYMALRPEPTSIPIEILYYSGSTTELPVTDNPNDRYLYRKEGNEAVERVGIVTKFNLAYYNILNEIMGTPVQDDSLISIKLVEVTLEVQSPYSSYVDEYGNKRFASALWKQTRLASQNLRR